MMDNYPYQKFKKQKYIKIHPFAIFGVHLLCISIGVRLQYLIAPLASSTFQFNSPVFKEKIKNEVYRLFFFHKC